MKYDKYIHEKGSREELLNRYYTKHSLCPICKKREHSQTLVAYIMDLSNPDAFEDKNGVGCSCGWTGTVHDLI